MNDSQILGALERFGAKYPWDKVSIWLQREAGGQVGFVAYIDSAYNRGISSACGHGATLSEAMEKVAMDAGDRDPESMRAKKVRDLKEQIAKLEAAQFGLPPYRPGTLLAPGALAEVIEL